MEFRCEDGLSSTPSPVGSILLENPEAETCWYFKHFLGRSHDNYSTTFQTVSSGPEKVLLSVLIEPMAAHDGMQSRVILWTKHGSQRLLVQLKKTTVDLMSILVKFGRGVPDKKIELITSPLIQKDLIQIEEQEGSTNFKFGILPRLHGQVTDDMMFSNEHGSPAFNKFCELVGDLIVLKGFTSFRGGLDCKHGTTGIQSRYTVACGKEIMFHVSPLLPYSKTNPQQLERKRHISNNICNIIFQEGDDDDAPFSGSMIKSQFTHIYAVVTWHAAAKGYSLKVFSQNSVPEFGPPLPHPALFTDHAEFRQFLLIKLMNAQKAALSSAGTAFADKKIRTLYSLIEEIYNYPQGRKADDVDIGAGKAKSSDGKRVYWTLKAMRLKEDEEEFRSFGQTLKMEKVASGNAPTSLLSTMERTSIDTTWAMVPVLNDYPSIVCAASTDLNCLLVASATEVINVNITPGGRDSLAYKQIVSTLAVTQIEYDDIRKLVIFLAQEMLHAISFQEWISLPLPLSKKTVKKYQIDGTKGCHLFCINRMASYGLNHICASNIAVALGKKVRIFEVVTNQDGRNFANFAQSFQQSHELLFSEHIIAVGLGHGNSSDLFGQLCVGTKSGDFILNDLNTMMNTILSSTPGGDGVSCISVHAAGIFSINDHRVY